MRLAPILLRGKYSQGCHHSQIPAHGYQSTLDHLLLSFLLDILHALHTFEVRVLCPQNRLMIPCGRQHDAVRQRHPMLNAQPSCAYGDAGLHFPLFRTDPGALRALLRRRQPALGAAAQVGQVGHEIVRIELEEGTAEIAPGSDDRR